MSVYVPTVERVLAAGFFWSMTMVTGRFSIFSTSGRPYLGRYCCTKLGKVSFNSRLDSAAMVSRQSEDLPEPDTPVNTVIFFFLISKETCFRLFSDAPVMRMMSGDGTAMVSLLLCSVFLFFFYL